MNNSAPQERPDGITKLFGLGKVCAYLPDRQQYIELIERRKAELRVHFEDVISDETHDTSWP